MSGSMLSSVKPLTDIPHFDMLHAGKTVAQRRFSDTGLSGDTDGISGEDLADLFDREHLIMR